MQSLKFHAYYSFQNSLKEAWQYRQANEEHYTASRDDEIYVEFLPWTGKILMFTVLINFLVVPTGYIGWVG